MKELLQYSLKLKHLPRSGWVQKDIKTPESVASHSWNMALMALSVSGYVMDTKYDFDKVIKLCLCHDLAESEIGDITPHEKSYKEKGKIEKAAMLKLAEISDFPEAYWLFLEYEEQKTPEAKLTHDLDKLDMYTQAKDYQKKYPDKNLDEFFTSATNQIKTPLGKKILASLQE